jgi:hypothetical protein
VGAGLLILCQPYRKFRNHTSATSPEVFRTARQHVVLMKKLPDARSVISPNPHAKDTNRSACSLLPFLVFSLLSSYLPSTSHSLPLKMPII